MIKTDSTLIYSGKDGCRITAVGGTLTVRASDGATVAITIPDAYLVTLAARALTSHADDLTTAQDDAKNAGFLLACNLRGDIADLRGQRHPEAVRAMRSALGNLAKQDYLDHAISGFSLAMANTLERGIERTEPYGQPRP